MLNNTLRVSLIHSSVVVKSLLSNSTCRNFTKPGFDGAHGSDGKDGFPGEKGENGCNGSPGLTGYNGSTGKDGLPGAAGYPSKDGRLDLQDTRVRFSVSKFSSRYSHSPLGYLIISPIHFIFLYTRIQWQARQRWSPRLSWFSGLLIQLCSTSSILLY